MKKVVSISLVFTLVLVVLSIEGVRGDDSTDLAKLQPLSTKESRGTLLKIMTLHL